MGTLTRKQREIQEREERILDVSRELFVSEGYHGLSMERIAATLEYAKGTIYNHFPCKEEILLALANETVEKRTSMFRQGAMYNGCSRERLCAIGAANEAFVLCFPNHFRTEQLVHSTSIWEKTSEKRQKKKLICESQCMETVAGVVRDGIAAGDVEMPDGMTAEDFVFGLWSLTFGAFSIISTSPTLPDVGIRNPFMAVRRNLILLTDGLGWRPDSTEIDYMKRFDEIQEELFGVELAKLA